MSTKSRSKHAFAPLLAIALLTACGGGKGSGQSALLTPVVPTTQPIIAPVPNQQSVPIRPSRGRPSGGSGSTSDTSVTDTNSPYNGGSSGRRRRGGADNNSSVLASGGPTIRTSNRPIEGNRPTDSHPESVAPANDDSRDAGRRMLDGDCAEFRQLTKKWRFKVDANFEKLDGRGDDQAEKLLASRAREFFTGAACDGLRLLGEKNPTVSLVVQKNVSDKEIEIKITDKNDQGKFTSSRRGWKTLWMIPYGDDQIRLGRGVLDGLILAAVPEQVHLLGSDVIDTLDREDIIQGAKATFFHHLLHLAGVWSDEKPHRDTSFLGNRKELDAVHACTAQAFPYFAVAASNTDAQGKTQTGPFYLNSRLACLTCASAVALPNAKIVSTIHHSEPDEKLLKPEWVSNCSKLDPKVENLGPALTVMPDRAAHLYQKIN